MSVRHISFAELPVTDQARATRFYVDVLGFSIARDEPYTPSERWVELSVGDSPTRLLLHRVEAVPDGERPALCLSVADVRATAGELHGKGVHFIQPAGEAPWAPGRHFAVFRDSEGNPVLLDEPR